MGRKPKPKTILLVPAQAVGSVREDRVVDPAADPDRGFMEEIYCPAADGVLIAMRRAFSLTYPRNPFIQSVQAALLEIRKIGVEALKPMPQVLSDLNLPPVPAIIDDPAIRTTHMFQFVFVRQEEVDITVKVSGKGQRLLRRPLLSMVQHRDAAPLLVTLRSVISATFAEVHNEDQHMDVLHRIREQIGAVLPAFNDCLRSIEIEPIASKP